MKNQIGGVILLVIGGVFLLDNLGLIPDIHIGRIVAVWWPVVLIVIGIRMLMRPERPSR